MTARASPPASQQEVDLLPPTLADVRRAAAVLEERLSLPTPLVESPALSSALDGRVFLKLETATPIAAFKVRGGINLLASLADEQRRRGVITASTGNHGQSIAYAARLFDAPARVFMPVGANPAKVAAIERLGAEVVIVGERFDDARRLAEEEAAISGARYVHVANEPLLIAGVATAALEVLERQLPDADVVIVPVGGGSGACGWITVRDGLKRPLAVWGAQSAAAPAVHDSWRAAALVERSNTTRAEGLQTAVPFRLPFEILQRGLDEFVLVSDEELDAALRELIASGHVLAELAGAAGLAAAQKQRSRLAGKRVVLVISGANVTTAQLRQILA
jgi:threonine dehydratase